MHPVSNTLYIFLIFFKLVALVWLCLIIQLGVIIIKVKANTVFINYITQR